jgi:hypothetical protein
VDKKLAVPLAAAAVLCFAPPVRAMDSVSFGIGGGDSTDMVRVGAQSKWKRRWLDTGNWHLGGYWDLQAGYWKGHSGAGGNTSLADLGFTPTFRVQQSARSSVSPYLEAAIGFHYLSKKRIHASKRFGTRFEFGDHVGAGVRFGERGRYDLGVRLQHLSNANLEKPNPGINFLQLRFQQHFD